jgi:hypothetical protein
MPFFQVEIKQEVDLSPSALETYKERRNKYVPAEKHGTVAMMCPVSADIKQTA